jgi:hypothetical protein
MKFDEKPPTSRDLQTRSIRQTRSTGERRSAQAILHVSLAIVIVGVVLCAPVKSPILAGSRSQADSQDAPAIDPGAMHALDEMGIYLRTLKSFQVVADVTTDDVLDDGETIQFSSKADLVAARPNRMRVEVTDDDGHRFFFFDGKNFTIYGQVVNYYTTVPAPSTIGQLSDDLSDKYGIELPLTDLFQWGTNDATIQKIKAAVDIGPSAVDGVTCEHYASVKRVLIGRYGSSSESSPFRASSSSGPSPTTQSRSTRRSSPGISPPPSATMPSLSIHRPAFSASPSQRLNPSPLRESEGDT